MGERGGKYFKQADELGGLVGRMRLASISQITSTEASSTEDTPELLARLERALQQVKREGGNASPERGGASPALPARPIASDARILRRHLATFVELTTQRGTFLNDLRSTLRRVDQAASFALDVARVSVWFLDPARTKITCADLFVRSTGEHASGTELFGRDFSAYFAALTTERTIAAHDAHKDPRTSCFSESYLSPLGITSMLDVPIWVDSKMVGVICHEHIGPARTWNSDEETFAYLMSNIVALALERNRPQTA